MSTISKAKYYKKPKAVSGGALGRSLAVPLLLGILFFIIVCLGAVDSIKVTAMVVAVVSLFVTAARFGVLRERICIPFLAMTLFVLMDGVSTFYALSGKFALREFLKVFLAYCLALILLAASPEKEEQSGRRVGIVLSVCAALGCLISIDLISTRFLSGAFAWFIGRFTDAYADLEGVEAGSRMLSIFVNPNAFAGFSGIGTLISLGLVGASQTRRERCLDLVLLYLCSLGFLLAFSMGATIFIALAFLVFLFLEQKEKRAGLFLLMLETVILVVLAAALVSATSFDKWDGARPIPLLCAVLGAALLCVLDSFVIGRIADRLQAYSKTVWIIILVIVVLLGAFALAAWNLTDSAALAPGETLRRSAYPAPGDYTLGLQYDGAVSVTVESQNRQDTMMHTSTRLYRGDAAGAAFTVPEDSLVVYFTFSTKEGATIHAASVGNEKIPLHYKLLPGFIANRLQGIRANQNAIQRFVFFEDGIKLFHRSPVVGLGMGSFENAIKSVQSFYYETKYAHNHYIQALLETGIVGLALFLAMFVLNAVAVWKERKRCPFAPMLGAALVFMAGHAAVEIVFSNYAYLPMAFGVFVMVSLGCGSAIEKPKLSRTVKSVAIGVIAVCTLVYCGFLAGNVMAKRNIERNPDLNTLQRCVKLDRFEWADYALPYVTSTIGEGSVNPYVRQQADEYAERLAKVNSNTIPIYLAEYYFNSDRPEQAIAMVEKYVDYVSSDQNAWQRSFDLMQTYAEDTEVFRSGVVRLADRLDAWNAENMGSITLSDAAQEFIATCR